MTATNRQYHWHLSNVDSGIGAEFLIIGIEARFLLTYLLQ